MFTVLLISATVLIVQVFSITNIDNEVNKLKNLPDAFYLSVNEPAIDFSHRNYNKKNGFNYNDSLCMSQVLYTMDSLRKSELWAIMGEYQYYFIFFQCDALSTCSWSGGEQQNEQIFMHFEHNTFLKIFIDKIQIIINRLTYIQGVSIVNVNRPRGDMPTSPN